ncbi:MAG: 50S ribosomal protein L19 [Bdellovibrionaceae bacterium]|nr:50S ribosomal protein L19 [Pseudobdellovibrionaceae bacterium]
MVEQMNSKITLPEFKAGDNVKVHVRIKEGNKERIQIFEGLVIKKKNRGAGKSFTVRKISNGVGVERAFLENSPKVAKVEVTQAGKVRRAKLYYIRSLQGKAARIERDIAASNKAAAWEKAQKLAERKSQEQAAAKKSADKKED